MVLDTLADCGERGDRENERAYFEEPRKDPWIYSRFIPIVDSTRRRSTSFIYIHENKNLMATVSVDTRA
jgi:hypothetical protein